MAVSVKKILAAVDFSDCSLRALEKASHLAVATGATVDLLHVWELPSFLPPGTMIASEAEVQQPLIEMVRDRAKQQLEKFSQQATSQGIKVGELLSEEGDAWRAIVSTAEKGGYDLIAIGTMGRTGLMHALLGSVAEKVVRHSPVPVLTVRMPQTS